MTLYDTSSRLYWFLWIFIVLYTIGTGIYISVFIQNLNILHTYFANPGAPGFELLSYRGSFTDVTIRMSVFAHVLSIMFLMCLIAYRRSYGANVIWFLLYFLCFSATLFSMGTGVYAYTHCNGQNQVGNICNDLKYCCAPEIFTNPANQCPNVLPCDPPLEKRDLRPNRDFLGLFWLNAILFFGQIIIIVVAGIIHNNTSDDEFDSSYEEVDEYSILPKAPPPVKFNVGKRIHGLRIRK